MEPPAFRGELLLTLEEALEFNKNLEMACLKLYGFELGHVPWRVCAIDQSMRTHTPSSLSLATVLRELDATVDPLSIIKQPLNRRSSYKLDTSPVRSPSPPSPPPVEVNPEPMPIIKVEEKIEYDPESNFYKLLHPPMEKLYSLPEWAQSIHKIMVELCYMTEVKPLLEYFNPRTEVVDTVDNTVVSGKRGGKIDRPDDFGFEVLSDELNDILMDIDDTDAINRRGVTQEGVHKKENTIKSENNVDGHSSAEEVNPVNGVSGLTSPSKTNDPKVYDTNTDQSSKTINANISTNDSNSNNTDSSNKTNNTHGNNGLNEAHTSRGQSENDDVNVVNDTGVSNETNDKKVERGVKSEGNESVKTGLENDGVDEEKTNETETQDKLHEQTLQHEGDEEINRNPETTVSEHKEPESKKVKEVRGFEYILENLLDNKFENASYVFSLLYTFLVQQFKVALPGSNEWMCTQDISNKLEELRSEKKLNDSEKLHNFDEPPKPEAPPPYPIGELPAYREPKRPRTSMEDFEHELSLINNVNEYSPTISLPEVQNITDEERMEFYENAMLLEQDFQMELFTVFEHAAVWKIVGNGEIELDDQNTDPKIYRGMIKWVKEKRNLTPIESKETTLEPPQVSSEIVV